MTENEREHLTTWQLLLTRKIEATSNLLLSNDFQSANLCEFLDATLKLDRTLYDFNAKRLEQDKNFADLMARAEASLEPDGKCNYKGCSNVALYISTVVNHKGRHNCDVCPHHIIDVFSDNPRAFKITFLPINFHDEQKKDKI